MANNDSTITHLHLEEKLWSSAEKLRSNLDASEYRTVVLGLIFLKYISDLSADRQNYQRILTIPPLARWEYLKENTNNSDIGRIIDKAMELIELDNTTLKGVLPKNYSLMGIDRQRLGELIVLIDTIELETEENKNKDILGRIFEYFLGQFAKAEGKKGGQFYTPPSVVKLLIEMIKPRKGNVYDPCCGSGGMFILSDEFVRYSGGKANDISIFGQESNRTTWSLCKMNLAIRGIDGDIRWGDSFTNDLHTGLKADFILANPPFNVRDWKGNLLRQDVRWEYGIPPVRNANYAWIQHFIHHLSPSGIAGFILTNGSLSSTMSNEGNIRKNIVETDLVDCIVTLPDKLFYNTSIPACLWIINQRKSMNRRKEVLFIDTREFGELVDRVHKKLTEDEIQHISGTYNSWKASSGDYIDVLGYCRSVKIDQIRENKYILTPARYIGVPKTPDDPDEPFNEKMNHLVTELVEQFKESEELVDTIKENLGDLGFDL
ncbi:MAG: SAM-dependent DNA methyltransferase [Candidatus Heimdallarchaeota archaeon]|nr:MAG: SAM-dependent DNA methyltransferase [Candidatus Heimdallarchaeota archaeon]